jgi:hypothetical protein
MIATWVRIFSIPRPGSADQARLSAVVGVAVRLMLTVLVAVPLAAILWADAAAAEIQISIHLVLVPNQHIRADCLWCFQIAAADPIGSAVDVAGAGVLSSLRISTQRARERDRSRSCTLSDDLMRRDVFLDPVDQGVKIGAVSGS